MANAHEGISDPEANITPDRIFDLLGDLCRQRHYDKAQQVLDHALIAFGAIPDAAARILSTWRWRTNTVGVPTTSSK
ncbi:MULTISPECIES: hypothetical protein [unclassified Bradyrhizobium]|uniref:hypothetical protein n=1 Tax=unclassified Bradyrhizobium TaxID=2631580 RepID=UPI002FEF145D